MLVHNIGDRTGDNVLIFPLAPPSTRRLRWGIRPASISGRMNCQSAASQPTSNSRGGEEGTVASSAGMGRG